MSTDTLGVGIIGTNGIALGKHLPSLAKCPQARVLGFCDINEDQAQAAATQFGAPGAKTYCDYRQMLANPAIDVVHICTPNHLHAVMTIDSLSAGKHVMCEKPMARTSTEAASMILAATRSDKKLSIGYQNRFRSDTRYLKELCAHGELGDIYYAKALAVRRRGVPTWGIFLDKEKQGGGPLMDIGTHALDLTLWFMDNYDWESITGSVFHKMSAHSGANPFGPWDPARFTVEDAAVGFIRFTNGATVVLESSWLLNTLQVNEAKCVLCGTKAGADFDDGLHINGEHYNRLYINKPDLQTGGVDFYEGQTDDPAYLEMQSWLDCIINNTDPPVLPTQAAVVTQIIEGIYNSAAANRTIYNAHA